MAELSHLGSGTSVKTAAETRTLCEAQQVPEDRREGRPRSQRGPGCPCKGAQPRSRAWLRALGRHTEWSLRGQVPSPALSVLPPLWVGPPASHPRCATAQALEVLSWLPHLNADRPARQAPCWAPGLSPRPPLLTPGASDPAKAGSEPLPTTLLTAPPPTQGQPAWQTLAKPGPGESVP